ncbi:putative Phosphoglycerate mutase [Seiridium cardinale]|uniref:Phosphoglycerate mutase n=1 Tax=Seiridium cardinale TaxID=138064 RepID=A0ABR2XZY7_9PEZI
MVEPQSIAPGKGFNFQSLKGYFVAQESMDTDADDRKITQKDLGLLPRAYLDNGTSPAGVGLSPSWGDFAAHVKHLNESAADGVSYKVVFITRHGQGFHNVMESKVGTEAWESHWALLDGDGTAIWADADLTETGRQQAIETGRIWAQLIEEQKMPFPGLYTSPLQRCLKTSRILFQDLAKRQGTPYQPIVKELLRECMGRHTCDRRSSKTWIHDNFPECVFEEGFSEADELFDPIVRETSEQVITRQQAVLEDIFTNESSDFVSLTMHSMAGRFMMVAFGHDIVKLAPATTMVFLIKGEKLTK